MRRSFDGLSRMVREVVGEDPFSGHLFVFCNKRRDRVKILYWDRDGYAIWYKRLEKGTFVLPMAASDSGDGATGVTGSEMLAILEGVDLRTVRRQARYRRPE